MRNNLKTWLHSSPIIAFFGLTFFISWGIWAIAKIFFSTSPWSFRIVVHNIGLFGPTLSAVILSGLLYGKTGVKDLLKRITYWRVNIKWYLFALFSALIIGFTAIGIFTLSGGKAPAFIFDFALAQLLLAFLPGEEYGWRGFALPHLQKKFNDVTASIIIGIFWLLWHIPISPIMNNIVIFGLFFLEVIPLSILFSWLYVNTKGSILLVVIYHFIYNKVLYTLNIPENFSLWLIYIVLTWFLVIFVISRYKGGRLSPLDDEK